MDFVWLSIHILAILALYDYQFSFYGKVPGNFKMPLFILVCLWAIELTSQKLILFAVLVSLFEPLREWLIFYRGWNLMGIAHYAIRLVFIIFEWYINFSWFNFVCGKWVIWFCERLGQTLYRLTFSNWFCN